MIDTVEDIEYFKNKTILLENQIAELKQMMIKIQNFAMETSMSLMKAKNGFDIEPQEQLETFVVGENIPITEIDDESCVKTERQETNVIEHDTLLDKTD